jgi:hypothetical protein
MNDKENKLCEIINSYAIRRIGNLSPQEEALNKYKTFCVELIQENNQLKELEKDLTSIYLNGYEDGKDKYKNIIKELRSWLEEYKENSYGLGSYETGISDALGDVLRKLNELEGKND